MDRRRFLRDSLLAAFVAGALPRIALAAAPDEGRSAAFARGLAREPWLAGWSNAAPAYGPTAATIEGRMPAALQGVLYRNGPAWFERAGFRYRHWFDGDGMVHAWRIGARGVSHRARMVETTKFVREQAAGRFLVTAAGTTVPDGIAVRNNDDMNTANTAVVVHGGRLLALWEGGSPIELDASSLATRGPLSLREDLVAAPFSAHPLEDADGSLWNVGGLAMLGASGVLVWNIDKTGSLRKAQVVTDDAGAGYVHSFAMTPRHLIVMLQPYTDGREGKSLFERMQFDARVPCRIAVIAKDALDAPRWFEVEHAAVYHWADAIERDGVIDVRAVRHHDIERARSPLAGAMRGERDADDVSTEVASLRIELARGRAQWIGQGLHGAEFPVFDPRSGARRRGRVYLTAGEGRADAPYSNAVASLSAAGVRDGYRYGSQFMVEEHRFVPRPGSSAVDDGWLVGTVLDYARGRSGLAVLDARDLAAGPLAIAWLPHAFPLGFHGWFHPA